MIDNRKTVFSDINTNASIARLLSGLNYEDFQRQQDFLRNIKGNSETNSIVNGILELMDRIADLYEEATGSSLTNRFKAVEAYSKLLLLLDDANNKDFSLSDFLQCNSTVNAPMDNILGYTHIHYGSIICTIASYYGLLVPVGTIYVLNTEEDKTPLERIPRKTFIHLLKEATPLTLEEMEAAELCAGGGLDDLR